MGWIKSWGLTGQVSIALLNLFVQIKSAAQMQLLTGDPASGHYKGRRDPMLCADVG